MKAISYQQFGGVEVLSTVEESTPLVKTGQVLVKVKSVSINPMDWKIRKGKMKLMSGSKFPRHTGVDFSGIIEDARDSHFKKGDEVFAVVRNSMKDGALAEFVAVPAKSVWKKPASLNFDQAASLPIVGAAAVTAFQKMGRINAGTEILIIGATGGFGMILLQLLKATKANVTAVVNPQAAAFARSWGASTIIDYTKENALTQGKTYDIVVDLSGKTGYARARQIMKPKAMFLNPTPMPIELPVSVIKNIFRSQKHVALLTGPTLDNMAVLVNAISHGLQIEVNRTFPFAQAVDAYRFAEAGGVIGKVTIEVA